ncbi:transcriptional regulator [Halorubrum sp. CBA1125]|uniref:transcriptional regulator n=1 Tax=Halorubrum sp. CBA1125 TaxID=2668072 RepID=UPI0012E96594|nr:transcriptional regulator [Halorubrum sp. CBA1125]MUW15779.1 transcriptional regulator [Halorubrum sp. CBA1125]
MAKYSTGGGGGGDDGDSCELCGRETADLQRATVAGARLLVCSDCRPHDDASGGRSGSGGDRNPTGGGSPGGASDGSADVESRKQELARKQAKMYDSATGDSSHWEKEGTNYESDRLPYLVSGYDDVVEEARQEAGLTLEELAEELGVDEDDLFAIEDGRAATAGVGGSVVRAVEERLGIDIVEE